MDKSFVIFTKTTTQCDCNIQFETAHFHSMFISCCVTCLFTELKLSADSTMLSVQINNNSAAVSVLLCVCAKEQESGLPNRVLSIVLEKTFA